MALTLAPISGENALNTLKARKARATWVNKNRGAIRDAYKTLGFPRVTDAQLDEMARGNTPEYGRALKVVDYANWAREFKTYSPEGIKPKYVSGNMKSKKVATMAYIEKLIAEHGTLDNYSGYLEAKRTVDQLKGTPEGKIIIGEFGYDSLVKAYQGVEGYSQLVTASQAYGTARETTNLLRQTEAGQLAIDQYGYVTVRKAYQGTPGYEPYVGQIDYLQALDPVMMKYFNRHATKADVTRLMPTYSAATDYETFLVGGQTAETMMRDIETGDLGAWGVGDFTAENMQQAIFEGNKGLTQAKVDEARVRRKNAFTPGESLAATEKTKSGQFKQNLF